MQSRAITLYPLIIIPRHLGINASQLFTCIRLENFPSNEVQFPGKGGVKTYSVIGDKIQGQNSSIIQGRFIRLNKEIKGKIKENPPSESELQLLQDEYLEEEAYFLFDTLNDIILAEYNPNSVNVLTGRIIELLRKAILNCNHLALSEIIPIPVSDFLSKIEGSAMVSKIRISTGWANMDYLEEIGIASRKLKVMGNDSSIEITQTVKFRYRINASREYLVSLRGLKERLLGNAKSIKVYTDMGNFDLIKDNYVSFEVEVNDDMNHSQMMDTLHREIYNKYLSSQSSLLQIVKGFRNLNDFGNSN